MRKLILSFVVLLSIVAYPQTKLLIRCDDIGMSHSVNMALKELISSGTLFSASVMFNCPWYQEAVDILKQNPDVSVGIHLTLNAEWKNYRWGPVCGRNEVASLVDSCGYFFPSRAALYANKPKLKEIEKELTAQVERGMKAGLKIDYIDYHMGTAVDKPEYRKIVEKLARKYKLGISRYFGEIDTKNMYSDPIGNKTDSLMSILSNLENAETNLLVCHIGKDNEELQAMIDLNPGAPEFMSRHRQAELNALTDKKIMATMRAYNIRILTYRQLIEEIGLDNMKSPVQSGY